MSYDEDTASQNDYYANFPILESGWLYIAIDIRDMRMVKIGLTTRNDPYLRVKQGKTYNPFLTLFAVYELSKCTYGISQQELRDIEGYMHKRSVFGEPLRHFHTGQDSEWFFIDPDEAEFQMDYLLAKRGFSVDGKNLQTYSTGYEKYNDIVPERMRKIKKIFRPEPQDFEMKARRNGIPYELYQPYHEYLVEFHQRDSDGKIYLE